MDLQEILSVAIGTLIVVVLSHFAVFWVVRTLYPPQNQTVYMPAPVAPEPMPVFTPPAVTEQHVTLPTYETAVPAEAPREERKGPPPAENTSIRREPGVDVPNA
jgi:hypothetical protein